MERPEHLLTKVQDKQSFIEFVTALAQESEHAIKQATHGHQLDADLGWKNVDVSNYLYAALDCFESRPLEDQSFDSPSWRMFAEFLYYGKIIE